jgi:hypothetical protein
MLRKLQIILLFFTMSFTLFSQSGKLNKGKESLKSSSSVTSSSSSSSTSKRSSKSSNNTDEDSIFRSLFGEFFIKLFAYTTYGLLIETPFELNGRMHTAEIAHFPYENSTHGNFIYTDSINYNIVRFDFSNNFVMENRNLYGNNFGLNFRFLKRFSIDFGYLYLTEKSNFKRDYFSLYSALLKYHRIRTQNFDAWFSLGVMHVGYDVNKSGFGVGLGGELFVKKPVSLLFSHKWTKINNEEVNNTKILLKYHIRKYHISSGYEHFKIGVSKINTFSLGIGASF